MCIKCVKCLIIQWSFNACVCVCVRADCPAGCIDVTPNSGFNARIMWRGDQLMSYSYYAGMPPETNCGENWYWDSTTSSGTWHTIEMYLKINTDGALPSAKMMTFRGLVDIQTVSFRVYLLGVR